MMLPAGYTLPLIQRQLPHAALMKRRQCLLGNAWHAGVAAFWLQVLLLPLLGRAVQPSADVSQVVFFAGDVVDPYYYYCLQ